MNKSKEANIPFICYEGKLIVIDGEYKLTSTEVEFANESITIINNGVLDLASNVEPKELYNKIKDIHNFGVINSNDKQSGVIQSKMKTNKGIVGNAEIDDEEDLIDNDQSNQNVIANMNYLKL
ncbi:hypothetical protein [Pseudalkalibacillus berkeleyi]|uniref:Uncharacterized protein n=1 Tax=Pseudalkalibacillus berkeleyi TaxID=1069813 RepID=A0ABS9GXJ2_9BACL|nr:hypothetical protein [Pseudalkalibacillus berkeleyi]MCF6137494.1 hypothetical protein [Pseudalkalibacillus berkeleyi]